MNNIAAIILAAGRGRRIKAVSENKVVYKLNGRPMILYPVQLFEKLKIKPTVVVVGFEAQSVKDVLGEKVLYVAQKDLLGTANAVSLGLSKISERTSDVLVVNGDDSAFYKESLIKDLIKTHLLNNSSATFVTVEMINPKGLGRVVRDFKGHLKEIIEEKDAAKENLKIKEVNAGCYIFKIKFLKNYLAKIEKSKISGEYYLPSIINIGIKSKEKIEALIAGRITWRGINTNSELKKAQNLFLQERYE